MIFLGHMNYLRGVNENEYDSYDACIVDYIDFDKHFFNVNN